MYFYTEASLRKILSNADYEVVNIEYSQNSAYPNGFGDEYPENIYFIARPSKACYIYVMADCIFCKIVKGEIAAEIVWEDDKHIAILDIFPNTQGFTVVLPKQHLPSYAFDNDDQVLMDLIVATKKVAKALDMTFDDVARCGMFFEGLGVDHLHAKLSPMHGTSASGGDVAINEKDSGPFYDKYPGFLSSLSSKRADDEKLKQLAGRIRESAKNIK